MNVHSGYVLHWAYVAQPSETERVRELGTYDALTLSH